MDDLKINLTPGEVFCGATAYVPPTEGDGKYYTQDGIVYVCTRDTVNPVYNNLADLVGIYVERYNS